MEKLKGGKNMVVITEVAYGSRAYRAGLEAGDKLLTINGNEINDVLDYRFYLTDTRLHIVIERNGEVNDTVIRKGEHDDIGLEFETPLMDKKHSCRNKCIFCFIDQLPKGMRDTLYFKDDDSRLSFLHGNYVTLTNMSDEDIDRIIKMHISPVNISVHTTNPELRCKMMNNKRAGYVLGYLKRLADAGIKICGQIVLCKGVNDGDELTKSMHDLATLYPATVSVSVVPAGMTKFRDGLYPLEQFAKEDCRRVIAQVDDFANKCLEYYGSRIVFCSDEFYLKAELPLPGEEFYEDYSQIENGVGMITSLKTEFYTELEYLDEYTENFKPTKKSIATGEAAYPLIKEMADALMARVKGLEINVYKINNDFFGDAITVAGLLTGKDLYEQLKDKDLGEELLIPSVTLRDGEDVFLCGMTLDELSDSLGVKITPTSADGAEFIRTLLN